MAGITELGENCRKIYRAAISWAKSGFQVPYEPRTEERSSQREGASSCIVTASMMRAPAVEREVRSHLIDVENSNKFRRASKSRQKQLRKRRGGL